MADPYLISAGVDVVTSLFGMDQQQDALIEATQLANEAAMAQQKQAQKYNNKATAKANEVDKKNLEDTQQYNANQTKQAQVYNANQQKAQNTFNANQTKAQNQFNSKEAALQRQATEAAAVQAREWAVADYEQQKTDQLHQYETARAAAELGGFNPLTVLGAGSTVPNPAGGLTSSSYAAASGVGTASGSGASSGAASSQHFPSSVPMTYGAPIAVTPVASNDAVLGAVSELGRELTGTAAIQRSNEELYNDLARIELDQARAGLSSPIVPDYPAAITVPGVGTMAPTAVRTGSTANTAWDGGAATTREQMSSPNPHDPNRPVDVAPMTDTGLLGRVSHLGAYADVPMANGEIIDNDTAATMGIASLATPHNREVVWGEGGWMHGLMQLNGLAASMGPSRTWTPTDFSLPPARTVEPEFYENYSYQ